MAQREREGQALIVSYLNLRAAIGFIAVAMALSLWPLHLLLAGGQRLHSISQAYYTEVAAVFVGCLCAIGVFLLSYRGYETVDRVVSALAGVAALLVAQVPCGCGFALPPGVLPPPLWGWSEAYRSAGVWNLLHYASAVVLFLMLAVFCLCLFPRSRGGKTREKRMRNAVYRGCGAFILGCMALLALDARLRFLPAGGIYWGEALMVVAFGLSWVVKGEALWFLNDRGGRGRHDASPAAQAR